MFRLSSLESHRVDGSHMKPASFRAQLIAGLVILLILGGGFAFLIVHRGTNCPVVRGHCYVNIQPTANP